MSGGAARTLTRPTRWSLSRRKQPVLAALYGRARVSSTRDSRPTPAFPVPGGATALA
jgi:hypothetical protein